MALDRQRARNINDTAALSGAISLNSSTSITISNADDNRVIFILSNPSNKQIWLKFQAASTDDDKKGIAIPSNSIYEMPNDNIYTGEISAIADSGSPDIYLTEF